MNAFKTTGWILTGMLALAQANSALGQCNEWVPGPAPVTSPQGGIFDFDKLGTSIFAVGSFTYPTPTGTAHNIARWNGSGSVSPLVATVQPGGEGTNGIIYAVRARLEQVDPPPLFPQSTRVYVGGLFTMAGNASANNVARYTLQSGTIPSTSTWSTMGAGFNNVVYALEFHNNDVYAGGAFTMSGSTACHRIARWTGTSWQPVGNFVDDGNGTISSLASYGGMLYVGGYFTVGNTKLCLARWNGTTWQYFLQFPPIQQGSVPVVTALGVHDGKLIVGGLFHFTSGAVSTNCLIAFDGTNWLDIGSTNSYVRSITTHNGDLVIGGNFSSVEGVSGIQSIAIRDSTTGNWEAAGLGISIIFGVEALCSIGTHLHAGGQFPTPNGAPFIASPGWWIWETDCQCPGDLVTSATFQPPPDGNVDGADLAFLLGAWGNNPGSPADLVTSATFQPPPDGVVNGADLATLLGAWGRCQ